MKRLQNNSTRASVLQITLSVALISISAILLASSFKAAQWDTAGPAAPGTATSGHINNSLGQYRIETIATTFFSENFDSVTPPALPAGWTAANASGPAP